MKLVNLLVLMSLFVVSCGSDDTSSSSSVTNVLDQGPSNVITATFVDSHVEGLSYNGLHSKQSGKTNSEGQFQCQRGERVQFSIGKLILGQAICNEVITPESLYEDPYHALKVGFVLINLDYNDDTSDGIRISPPVQEQDLFEADLADLINLDDDNLTLETGIINIVKNSPPNSFFFDVDKYIQPKGLFSVRDHYEISFVPMGRYEGEITKLTVNQPEGQCEYRKYFRVNVGATDITFPGFAGLEKEELEFKVPRKIDDKKSRNTFNKTFNYTGFTSNESDELIEKKRYDRVVLKGNIKGQKLTLNFKLGDINNNGAFEVECAGKAVLNKIEAPPLFYEAIRLSQITGTQTAAIQALAINLFVGAGIEEKAEQAVEAYRTYFECIFKNSITEETAYLCTDAKVTFDEKLDDLVSRVLSAKASNPLISDDIVDEANKAAKSNKKINQKIFF